MCVKFVEKWLHLLDTLTITFLFIRYTEESKTGGRVIDFFTYLTKCNFKFNASFLKYKFSMTMHRLKISKFSEGLANSSEMAPNRNEETKTAPPPPPPLLTVKQHQPVDRAAEKAFTAKQVSNKPQQKKPAQLLFGGAVGQRQPQKPVAANLHTAEDRSDRKIVDDTLTTAANMQNKIRLVLADIKKEHSEIKVRKHLRKFKGHQNVVTELLSKDGRGELHFFFFSLFLFGVKGIINGNVRIF